VIGYYADPAEPFLGPRKIELQVVARSTSGEVVGKRTVVVTARGVAPRPALDLDPDRVRFGTQPFETLETRTLTIENESSQPLVVTIEAQLPDDFSDLIFGTCILGDTVLEAGEECTHVVGFRPTPFFGGFETASLVVTARDLEGRLLFERIVEMTGRGV
jgi:hypothetical protein